MKAVVKSNKVFLASFVICWLVVVVARLNIDKGSFLLLVSKYHSSNLNLFFAIVTQFAEELVFVVLTVVFLFVRYMTSILISMSGIISTISSSVLKPIFGHPRPYTYFEGMDRTAEYQFIEGIEPYTAMSSFPSGHTMAAFALFGILSFMTSKNSQKLLFLFIAALIGFSRIYLGHHFLEDVLVGSALGLIIALLMYYASGKLTNNVLQGKIKLKKKGIRNA